VKSPATIKNYLLFLLMLFMSSASGQGESVGVVYPDIREPYRSIFTSIIDGIKDTVGNDVQLFLVDKDESKKDLNEWITKNGIRSLIALGSQSHRLASTAKLENKIVGAIIKPPQEDGYKAGILLSPDPGEVIRKILDLVPSTQRIYLVYSRQYSDWYVELARSTAMDNGVQLVLVESTSKKESIRQYNQLFDETLKPGDGIWLLQDPLSSDSKVILPMVLEKAWEKKVPVFSNKAGHVERGVLLALYPDHFELGVSLGRMIEVDSPADRKYIPFTNSLDAANTRTADHLGLEWSRKTVREIKLVFPDR
jgi:putative ABC transport system substrate-binding protein